MTVVEMLGCLLVTFGAPASMFVVTVARKPLHVIMLMARYVHLSCLVYFISERYYNN